MHRGRHSFLDQCADQLAVAPLDGEIDGRWRTLLAPANLAQINRLAEPALRVAEQQNGLVHRLEGEARRLGEILDQTYPSDGRRRQDRAPVGLVVEADIA